MQYLEYFPLYLQHTLVYFTVRLGYTIHYCNGTTTIVIRYVQRWEYIKRGSGYSTLRISLLLCAELVAARHATCPVGLRSV